MAPLTYAGPGYSLGADETPGDKARAAAALRAMQASLKKWLKYRNAMNVAALEEKPGKRHGVIVKADALREERYATERQLASSLFALLTECGMPASALPSADVAADPDAAAKLAEIAIAGRCAAESSSPSPTGIIWFILIPVAGVILLASQWIKSQADVAMETERLRCVQSGHCTDEGFWIKVGAIALLGWLAWDKFGVREALSKKKAA